MAESPLGRLIGTWEFEPLVEGQSAGRGRATFEWIEDGAFVLERSDAEWTDPGWVENAPRSKRAVIGWDDSTDEIVQLYADSRGVFRIYRGTLTDDAWTLERAAPDFHQRFIGELPRRRPDDRRPMGVVAGRHGLGARLPDHLPQGRPS